MLLQFVENTVEQVDGQALAFSEFDAFGFWCSTGRDLPDEFRAGATSEPSVMHQALQQEMQHQPATNASTSHNTSVMLQAPQQEMQDQPATNASTSHNNIQSKSDAENHSIGETEQPARPSGSQLARLNNKKKKLFRRKN